MSRQEHHHNGPVFDYQGFAKAFSTYNKYRKSLKRIYQETLELHKEKPCDLQAGDCLSPEEKRLIASEDALMRNTVHNPLAFVIIGQTYKAKCVFANKLLGQEILPVTSSSWLRRAQMTKFKHGTRPQLSISMQENLVIIEPRLHSSASEEAVDWQQEFSLLEEDLKKVDGGVVEITLHHPILKGCQIIVTRGEDTFSDVISDRDLEIAEQDDLCTNGISPIFLYASEKEWIYAKEAERLNNFLDQYPDNAIAFSIHNYSPETENQPPKHSDTKEWEHCDENTAVNGTSRTSPQSVRHKEAMSDVSINTPHGEEDNLLSPTHHDICNNHVSASPLYEKKPKLVAEDRRSFSVSSIGCCVEHGNLSPNWRKMVLDLSVIGYKFACTCKAGRQPVCRSGNGTDTDWDSSGEEIANPDSCTQTNPSYVSLNLEIFNDTRLQSFPPSSLFIFEQRQEKMLSRVLSFTRSIAKYYLIRAAKVLHRLHSSVLDSSIRSAFQMSRDLMITPRRVEYAKQQENQLYTQLVEISTRNQSDIQELINGIKVGLRENILNAAESYDIPDDELSFRQVSFVKKEIQDLVLHHIKVATAERLYSSIQILRESYIGTLSRCLECLESTTEDEACSTSEHLRKILHAAYNVELNIQSSSSLARIMIDKLRQLLSALPWHEPPVMDGAWRRNVASNVLASLDDSRLAKSICSQFRARLQQSHSAFNVSLRQLESAHLCRLEHTEEKRHKVAKIVAPHIARLALESTSMIDSVLYGMPRMGREIGRGMYGVVYQCDQWSTWGPCAVKSVAPPDEKHANDLSLEFYYTRSLPEHPRVVQIRGSIVDESYGGGIGPPAVLLIMDRMHCDLYTSIKRGLSECSRMQIAIDVVEGIRFLHSQGLVHRDIKLKNVLLDRRNRARITDLGFCKPGAMMSGSIVGTPVHMPPELFTGKYDSSVDVYAFGILFWYLCAGVTRLPRNFESCTTKDHLWNAVRKGVRPERLPVFKDDCWDLMRACWNSDPMKRPLLGKIQPLLTAIHTKLRRRDSPAFTRYVD